MNRTQRIRLVVVATLGIVATSAFTAQRAADVSGSWKMRMVVASGTRAAQLLLKQDGANLSGTYESGYGPARDVEGSVKGDSVTFSFSLVPGSPITYRAALITPDSLSGAVDGREQAVATFTAARQK